MCCLPSLPELSSPELGKTRRNIVADRVRAKVLLLIINASAITGSAVCFLLPTKLCKSTLTLAFEGQKVSDCATLATYLKKPVSLGSLLSSGCGKSISSSSSFSAPSIGCVKFLFFHSSSTPKAPSHAIPPSQVISCSVTGTPVDIHHHQNVISHVH